MELVQFPGDHGGFVSQPTEFADYLDGVFHTRGEAWARGMRPIVMPRSSLIK
jgi:hypothetical protein